MDSALGRSLPWSPRRGLPRAHCLPCPARLGGSVPHSPREGWLRPWELAHSLISGRPTGTQGHPRSSPPALPTLGPGLLGCQVQQVLGVQVQRRRCQDVCSSCPQEPVTYPLLHANLAGPLAPCGVEDSPPPEVRQAAWARTLPRARAAGNKARWSPAARRAALVSEGDQARGLPCRS